MRFLELMPWGALNLRLTPLPPYLGSPPSGISGILLPMAPV
jgi:hypothetical protein